MAKIILEWIKEHFENMINREQVSLRYEYPSSEFLFVLVGNLFHTAFVKGRGEYQRVIESLPKHLGYADSICLLSHWFMNLVQVQLNLGKHQTENKYQQSQPSQSDRSSFLEQFVQYVYAIYIVIFANAMFSIKLVKQLTPKQH